MWALTRHCLKTAILERERERERETERERISGNYILYPKLLLPPHSWDKTKRLHIQHCYLFYDQRWASCVLGKEVPAGFPLTHPSSYRRRACKKIRFLCTTSWQKEAGSPTHLFHHIHLRGVRISWSWYISRWDSHTCRRSMCMEKSCNRLIHSRTMMIMMIQHCK